MATRHPVDPIDILDELTQRDEKAQQYLAEQEQRRRDQSALWEAAARGRTAGDFLALRPAFIGCDLLPILLDWWECHMRHPHVIDDRSKLVTLCGARIVSAILGGDEAHLRDLIDKYSRLGTAGSLVSQIGAQYSGWIHGHYEPTPWITRQQFIAAMNGTPGYSGSTICRRIKEKKIHEIKRWHWKGKLYCTYSWDDNPHEQLKVIRAVCDFLSDKLLDDRWRDSFGNS